MKMSENCAYVLLRNLHTMAHDLEPMSPISFLHGRLSVTDENQAWQRTVDILYRMIKSELFGLLYLPDDFDGNYQWFFDDISQHDPYNYGSNEWHIRECYSTEKCNELVKKYLPYDWDVEVEDIPVGLIEEIERIFDEAGVPWSYDPIIPIKPSQA